MAREHSKKASILVSHEPLFQAHQLLVLLASPLPRGEERTLLFQFHTLEKAQTEAEFRCIILLVSDSIFIQGPIKGKEFGGKYILKDALIPFTSRLPKAHCEWNNCNAHFKMQTREYLLAVTSCQCQGDTCLFCSNMILLDFPWLHLYITTTP